MSALELTMMKRIGELKAELTDCKAEADRLKAEVERLDTLCKQLMAQHCDISCENIMLRKAGDAMAITLQADYNGVPFESLVVINAIIYWNAAKKAPPNA